MMSFCGTTPGEHAWHTAKPYTTSKALPVLMLCECIPATTRINHRLLCPYKTLDNIGLEPEARRLMAHATAGRVSAAMGQTMWELMRQVSGRHSVYSMPMGCRVRCIIDAVDGSLLAPCCDQVLMPVCRPSCQQLRPPPPV